MAIAGSGITGSTMTAGTSVSVHSAVTNAPDVKAVSSSHSQDNRTKQQDQTTYAASTSYGDTIQVSNDSRQALYNSMDGTVTETGRKTDDRNQVLGQDSGNDVEENIQLQDEGVDRSVEQEQTIQTTEQSEERSRNKLTNLNGYTAAQLRTFYLEGRISLYDYEQEIDKNKERLQETEEQQMSTDKVMAQLAMMQKNQAVS